ncbi:excinuclease ABC subunit UvrA, partial [Escherichia coli]|nr:excinuclease ABC subunit UvrA [Escherichia coli]
TYPEGTRFQILAPVVRDRKGEYADVFTDLAQAGYTRARVDSEDIRLDNPPSLDKKLRHNIDVVVDRLVVREGITSRHTDSVEQALGLSSGLMVVEFVDAAEGEER